MICVRSLSEGLKPLETGGLAPLHIYLIYSSASGALAQVVNQVLQVGLFALSNHFYPPIRQIFGIA